MKKIDGGSLRNMKKSTAGYLGYSGRWVEGSGLERWDRHGRVSSLDAGVN